MSEYETLGSGRIASYLVTDLQTIDDFISNTISRFLIAVLTIIGVAIILFYMHLPLVLLVLTMNPIVIFFTVVLGKHVKKLKKEENTAFEIFQHSLIETLDAIHQIRADNREHHYIKYVVNQACQSCSCG